MNRLVSWIDARFPLIRTLKNHATEYYVPKNLNVYYVFGVLALLLLLNQCLTGLWLTMFYTPTAKDAFDSIESIMRDVPWGWLLRYMHSTGASALFMVLYFHLFRALLYGSYQKPRELVWILGMFLFILLMTEAFFGYLLPWGQMSYWGAEVITSLLGSIPYVGDHLVQWLRGDFQVSDVTLHRFFALHVIGIPLLIIGLVFLHLVALHHVGSNNPEGIDIYKYLDVRGKPLDGVPFHPYYTVKDFVGILIFLILFFSVVFFWPTMGGYFLEAANFTPADPFVTPEHITPVWYMTPFYSMLRAIPNKLGGVLVMVSSIFILFFIPWLDKSPVLSMRYKGRYSNIALRVFILSFFVLGYLGTVQMSPLKQYLSILCIGLYFAYFVLMPIYSRHEQHREVPERME